jgi:hypothetical protein
MIILPLNNMSKCTPKECEQLYNSADKWKVSVLSGFIFMLVSSPFLYQMLDKVGAVMNIDIASSSGCPTFVGLFITTVLFVIIVRFLMQ